MGIFRGTNEISKIYRGTNEIVKVFRGVNLIFTSSLPEYELIADINVATATTQIDFDNLNITKDDELRLVYTFKHSGSTSFYELRPNDISSGYVYQELYGIGSSLGATRLTNDSRLAVANSSETSTGFMDIKISNNDRFVVKSQFVLRIGSQSSNIVNYNCNAINTNTVSSITKLSVVATQTNGIGVGTRLQLYKVNKGVA